MSLKPKLFWKAFKQANEASTVDCLQPAKAAPYLKWLQTRLHHPELIALLREFSFVEAEQLCAQYFHGPKGMKEVTESSRLLAEKFVVIGGASNGDYIAIPLARPGEVGFVNHETLDDAHGVCEYVAVCNSIGEIYYNSWNKKGFPMDYYDAVRNWKPLHGKLGKSRRKDATPKRKTK